MINKNKTIRKKKEKLSLKKIKNRKKMLRRKNLKRVKKMCLIRLLKSPNFNLNNLLRPKNLINSSLKMIQNMRVKWHNPIFNKLFTYIYNKNFLLISII